MNKKLVVANWKMNLTIEEGRKVILDTASKKPSLKKSEIWIAPSFTSLYALAPLCRENNFSIGAQNISWKDSGAFTGDISSQMLKEIGVNFVITGHSERRKVFLETDAQVLERTKKGLEEGFKTILCVGETLEEREANKTEDVLKKQLESVDSLSNRDNLIIAYEPVWAIGTGENATTEEIKNAHQFINSLIPNISILYGGSVTPENFGEIIKVPLVDGALVGGASLVAEKFFKLCEIAENS